MIQQPYHHGHLRAALLEQAERTVRERGAQALSLRQLARDVGVSHGAPRRHFADRQALLDALAETGFARLGAELRSAVDGAGEDFEARLRATATAYVRFATRDAEHARRYTRSTQARGPRRPLRRGRDPLPASPGRACDP